MIRDIDKVLARVDADRPLMMSPDGVLTYGNLKKRISKLRGLFGALGLTPGNRVVIASDNDETVVTVFFALLTSGLTAIISDGRTTPHELSTLIASADPAAVFVDEDLLAEFSKHHQFPASKTVCLNARENQGARATHAGKVYPDVLNEVPEVAQSPHVAPDTLALIVFTSGTTSNPKGVCLSHANLQAQLETFREIYGFDAKSRLLNILPLHHVDGLIRGPLAALWFNAQLFRPMRFGVTETGNLLDVILAEQITHFITVPALLTLVDRLGSAAAGAFSGPDFRYIISSADALDTNLWTRLEARLGTKIVNAYGLSEVVCDALFCGPNEASRKVGTLGKPVGCKAQIVDLDGAEAGVGVTGELILSGPMVMQGYFRSQADTDRVLRNGWFYTGDLVSCDGEGFYHFKGRKKSVIVSRGVTIYPESITNAVLKMPGIAEAVSFGVDDELWGQSVVACVVTAAGANISKIDVIDHCRTHLSPEKIPSDVYFLDELPRGPSGKIKLDLIRHTAKAAEPSSDPSQDVFQIAADCFNVPRESLSLESSPYNTEGWDSPAHLDFIIRLETHFGVSLSPEDIIELGTLADAETKIQHLLS